MGRIDDSQRGDELAWGERQKEELLAMLAHELRNPLVPLRNAAALLRRVQSGEPKVAYACALIDQQVGYLSRLVDELLDMSRLLRGRIALKTELVDMRRLLRQAAREVRQETRGRRQALSVGLPDGAVWVEGDYLRLLQAVEHLLNNASRYTQPEGDIFLELEAASAEVAVRVRDNGIGLSAELRRHIFELFAQGDRALDRAPGGLGLGLSPRRPGAWTELHQAGGGTARGPDRGRKSRAGIRHRVHLVAAALERAAGVHGFKIHRHRRARAVEHPALSLAGAVSSRDGPPIGTASRRVPRPP